MTIELPQAPELLPAETFAQRHRTWWEACDILIRTHQALASKAHAAAQQATAEAMQASTAAQQSLAALMAQPSPVRLPTRAELVFEMVKDQPQATVLTPAVVVKGAADIVDAYVAKYPGAVQP